MLHLLHLKALSGLSLFEATAKNVSDVAEAKSITVLPISDEVGGHITDSCTDSKTFRVACIGEHTLGNTLAASYTVPHAMDDPSATHHSIIQHWAIETISLSYVIAVTGSYCSKFLD